MSKAPLLPQTPSQTVGPFFAFALTPESYGYPWTSLVEGKLREESTAGTRIRIEGQVFDGQDEIIRDALIEIYQADASGRYARESGANAQFSGFGRCGTGVEADGRFVFETIKPGSVDANEAPHIDVIVSMRGMLTHAFTRIYFSDEASANASDPVLAQVPSERRHTLIAKLSNPGTYRFDVHMQGTNETVFFDI